MCSYDDDRYDAPTHGDWWFGINVEGGTDYPTDEVLDDALDYLKEVVGKAMLDQGSDQDVQASVDDWRSDSIEVSFILDGWYEDSAFEVARQVARAYGAKEVTYELNGNQHFYKLPVE